MNKIINIIKNTINIVGMFLMSSMVFAIGAQIFLRKFFNKPLKYPEELSMFALITIVFLGVNIVELYDSHIKVEFFFTKVSKKIQEILILLTKILTIVIILSILNGEKQLFPRILKLKTTAAGIPYVWLHTIIVISCIIWLFIIIFTIFKNFKEK